METELTALASAGATTLIGLMVSDSWTKAKAGFARLFARGDAAVSTLLLLETSQADLVAAQAKEDDAKAAAIEAEWRTRLHHLLQSDPAVSAELRHLLYPPGPESVGPVYNIISGGVRFGSVIQAGQVSGAAFHVIPASTPDERTGEHESDV